MNASVAIPWVTFGAIEWLDKNLGKDANTFEWGSGGSTLYFSERVAHHFAVEHAPSLYSVVSDRLRDSGISNCTYLFVEAVPLETMPCQCDKSGESCGSGVRAGITFASDRGSRSWRCYRNYVAAIEQFPLLFDFILIDGRARSACICYAINKVRPGGAIMLDNSMRKRYLVGCRLLEEWPRTDFCGKGPDLGSGNATWCTTVWTGPLPTFSPVIDGG